jgi:hypothetical protein
MKQQDFYYYDIKNNQERAGMWQNAWLQTLSDLNNTSKHIRLIPHVMTCDLSEKVAGLQYVSVRMNLHYIQPQTRLNDWSFFTILPRGQNGLDDTSALILSKSICDVLKSCGYFDKQGNIIHPLVLEILENQKIDQLHTTLSQEHNFYVQVEKDLPIDAKPFTVEITGFLRRQFLHANNHRFVPDRLVDLDNLFSCALKDISELLHSFGNDRKTVLNVSTVITAPREIKKINLPLNLELEVDKLEKHVQETTAQWVTWLTLLKDKPVLLRKIECQDFHLWLQAAIRLRKKSPKAMSELTDILHQAAHVMERSFPWLYRRA